MGARVVRYCDRPELWDRIGDLSAEVWPEYNRHGVALNRYRDRLYEVLGEWQFVRYDDGQDVVLAEGDTIPVAWDGTDGGRERDLGEYWEPNVWIIHPRTRAIT